MGDIELPAEATVDEFKKAFEAKWKFYPERQQFNIGEARGPMLKDGTLASNNLQTSSTVFFKDLGPQISWRLVFVIEYLGPILIFPLFYCLPGIFYGDANPQRHLVQKVAFWLTIIHYVKRELETLFVHRFSNATMPIFNLPKNCFHYWVIFGVSVGYFLFHPKFAPRFTDETTIYGLAALMCVFELLNLKTHIILRDLRPRGTKVKGLPVGWGFGLVSCANYFWETLAWTTFSVLVSCATAWIFVVVAFLQMAQWALKKHAAYKKDFKDYPRIRKAILPFLV